jgi:response regulator RpfG family c-di-GMP phosphodiesterase
MSDSSELFLFDDDDDIESLSSEPSPWKVLIVDDDSEMHTVTKLVLNNFSYQQRKLSFIDAYNAAEAFELLRQHADVAIALVDVVMESDDAGLKLIDDIRERLNNHDIRLILRTGQPGLAPIREVIRRYDVSDYKNKTELSDVNLDTLMCASLRAYQEISELHLQQNNLRAAIHSSSVVANCHDEQHLASSVYQEITKQLTKQLPHQALNGFALALCHRQLRVLHSQGTLAELQDCRQLEDFPQLIQAMLRQALEQREHVHQQGKSVFYLANGQLHPLLFYVEGWQENQAPQFEPLELYIQATAIRMENRLLQRQLAYGQLQLLDMVYQAIQQPPASDEHLHIVQQQTQQLAVQAGLSSEEAEQLSQVAAFYDLSQLGLPDVVLNCSLLSAERWKCIAEHYALPEHLKSSAVQQQINNALIVAYQYRENWDGSGLPLGLAGDTIHLYARIVALAVFYAEHAHQANFTQQLQQATGQRIDPQLATFLVKH